jgi:hypothetical protein
MAARFEALTKSGFEVWPLIYGPNISFLEVGLPSVTSSLLVSH